MERARVPRGCLSRAIDRCERMPCVSLTVAQALDPAQQVRELERGDRRIGALVAGLGAGALDRLLDGVRRQHAERDRHAGVLRDAREAAGAFAGDVVEVRRRALDHGAERDDGVVALAQRQLARDQRQVERARRAHDLDLLVARAVAPAARRPRRAPAARR